MTEAAYLVYCIEQSFGTLEAAELESRAASRTEGFTKDTEYGLPDGVKYSVRITMSLADGVWLKLKRWSV
jgi:hypothetical protein